MDEELRWLDGLAQAELVRTGKASPAEPEAEARERIRRLDPVLNALVWEAGPGGALADSEGLAHDAALPPPASGTPFAGVPFLVKDLALEIAGTPLGEGSRWTAGTVSAHTQELALRHACAGLVTLGKTATCEFGLAPHCEPAAHGRVLRRHRRVGHTDRRRPADAARHPRRHATASRWQSPSSAARTRTRGSWR